MLLEFQNLVHFYLVGCINAIKANVELYKNDNLLSNGQAENGGVTNKKQYLSVIIPEEFKDYAYIQVRIVKSNKKNKESRALFDKKFSLFTYNGSSVTQGWQEILEREQNSIYCKEIYNQVRFIWLY